VDVVGVFDPLGAEPGATAHVEHFRIVTELQPRERLRAHLLGPGKPVDLVVHLREVFVEQAGVRLVLEDPHLPLGWVARPITTRIRVAVAVGGAGAVGEMSMETASSPLSDALPVPTGFSARRPTVGYGTDDERPLPRPRPPPASRHRRDRSGRSSRGVCPRRLPGSADRPDRSRRRDRFDPLYAAAEGYDGHG